jgi:hypothetical protein
MAYINQSTAISFFDQLVTLVHEISRVHLGSFDKLRARNLKRHKGIRSFISDQTGDVNFKSSESYAQWNLQALLPDVLKILVSRGILIKHNPTGNNCHIYYTLPSHAMIA